MLKGKLKYIVLGVGVLVLSLGIMRYTPLAFGNVNGVEGLSNQRPYYERFMGGPRGHHRMMWDYDYEEGFSPEFREKFVEEYGQENWEEFRQHHRNYRPGRGCRGYFYDDYQPNNGLNK